MRLNVWAWSLALLAGCFGSSATPGTTTLGGIGDECGTGSLLCRAGLACLDSTCQPQHNGILGSSCALTADCAQGLYCGSRRTCVTAGTSETGERCATTADCVAGLSCTLAGFSGVCAAPVPGNRDLNDPCTATSDCYAGLTCFPGPTGAPLCQSAPPTSTEVPTPPSIPFWAGESCESDTGEARAYFDVPRASTTTDFYRLPFPNDVRRTATGLDLTGHPHPGTVLPVDVIDRYLRASETDLDGFATNPLIYFRFSQPYGWGEIGASVQLVDITEGSPTYGQSSGLAYLTTNGKITKYICNDWLALRTPHGAPLRPKTTYAAILKKTMRTSSNGMYARSNDFDAVLADSAPADSALMDAWTSYAPLRAYLASEGEHVAADDVLVATVFTTQDVEATPRALREAVRAADVPAVSDLTLCADGVTSPCDDGTPERACGAPSDAYYEIHGRIALPIFQAGTAPYLEPEDGGGITLDGDGLAHATRTEQVCFAMTIPKAGAMPVEGWPLVIYAHGTGGAFTGALGVADELASGDGVTAPAATLAIDMPQHGSRKAGSMLGSDVLFYNFGNPAAARGNIQQGAADLVSLVHFAVGSSIASADSPIAADIAFDDARLSLFAHSQGATHASLMVGFETDLDAVVLSGNGGDLVQSLLNKEKPVDIKTVFPFVLLDANGDGTLAAGEFHPVLGLFQAYFESADPVNFARRLWRERIEGSTGIHAFMTYGTGDSYSPEKTQQAYGAAAGFLLVLPRLVDFGLPTMAAPVSGNLSASGTPRTVALRQYTPNTGDDGHFVSTQTALGRADVLRFLRMTSAGELPVVGAAGDAE